MKTKIWMIAGALLSLVLFGSAMLSYAQDVSAADGQAGWKAHRHHRMEKLAAELNLTDAQKAQIKTMYKASRQSNLPLMQQVAANRKALLAATADPNYDQAKVQAIANQQSQLMAQLIAQRTAMQHQIYTQVLTPEQRVKADELRTRQMARIDRRLERFATQQTPTAQ